ncbi:MAG: hypothetical protein WC261_08905 [Synergistaceae bacterium]|jgi:hypothetical protein
MAIREAYPNFPRFVGETFVLPISVTDDGEAKDLTNTEISFNLANGSEMVTEESEGYSIDRDDESGTFEIRLSSELTESLGSGLYPFEVVATYTDGVVEVLAKCYLRLNSRVGA